jgi:hypothetical protein
MITFSYKDPAGRRWDVEFGFADTPAGIEPAMRCRVNGQSVSPETVDRMLEALPDETLDVMAGADTGFYARLQTLSPN